MCGTNPRHIFFASCHCAHNVVFVPVHLAPLLKGYAPMARGTKSGGNLQNSSCTYKLLSTTIPAHNIPMLRICYFRLCDDANAKKFMFSQIYRRIKEPLALKDNFANCLFCKIIVTTIFCLQVIGKYSSTELKSYIIYFMNFFSSLEFQRNLFALNFVRGFLGACALHCPVTPTSKCVMTSRK